MQCIKAYIKSKASTLSKVCIVLAFGSLSTAAMTGGQECFPWCFSYYHLSALGVLFYVLSFTFSMLYATPKWLGFWQDFLIFNLFCAASGVFDELNGTAEVLGMHDFVRYFAPLSIYLYFKYLAPGLKRFYRQRILPAIKHKFRNIGRKWKIF